MKLLPVISHIKKIFAQSRSGINTNGTRTNMTSQITAASLKGSVSGLAGGGCGRGRAAANQLQCSGCNNEREKLEEVEGGRFMVNNKPSALRDAWRPRPGGLEQQADIRRRQENIRGTSSQWEPLLCLPQDRGSQEGISVLYDKQNKNILICMVEMNEAEEEKQQNVTGFLWFRFRLMKRRINDKFCI